MPRDRHLAAVVVTHDAPLFETSVPISVFGTDRTEDGAPPLRVVAAAEAPEAATTAGLSLSGLHDLAVLATAGVVIVPAWPHPETRPSDQLISALREALAEGATVMGLCMGAYALGHAGVLDGRRAITHWRWLADFAARFPDTVVDDSGLYVDEGRVITSAGTAAGLDACLHYVRREWGSQAASAIARRMVVAPHRAGNQNQFVTTDPPRANSPTIAAVQERALAMLPTSIDIDELARWYGTSRRTFDRDFRAAAGQSPLQWLLHQRILHAQRLLETSDLSIESVAHQAGFSSAVALRPHFRRLLGLSPQDYRTAFRTTLPLGEALAGTS